MKTNRGDLLQLSMISDELVFAACERLIRGEGPSTIAVWLQKQGVKCSREQIYGLVRRGMQRGFVQLVSPPQVEIERQLGRRWPVEFRVVSVSPDDTDVNAL